MKTRREEQSEDESDGGIPFQGKEEPRRAKGYRGRQMTNDEIRARLFSARCLLILQGRPLVYGSASLQYCCYRMLQGLPVSPTGPSVLLIPLQEIFSEDEAVFHIDRILGDSHATILSSAVALQSAVAGGLFLSVLRASASAIMIWPSQMLAVAERTWSL